MFRSWLLLLLLVVANGQETHTTPFKPTLSSITTVLTTSIINTGLNQHSNVTAYNSEGSRNLARGFVPDPALFAPDLLLDSRSHVIDWRIEPFDIKTDSCAVQEGCVESGRRSLLRFNTHIINNGTADFVVGSPRQDVHDTFFHYNICHRHFHIAEMLDCSLEDANGRKVAKGMKIGFCLEDYLPATFPPPPVGKPRYNCEHQGISAGWKDAYNAGLDCQWIDVTMVPAGQYFLVIAVNENRVFHELSYDNNRISVPITIGSAPPKSKPMNDHCVDAIQVQAGFHYKIHTRGSTTDKLKCNGVTEPDHSVWYQFKGTGKRILVSTCNSDTVIDTVVLVFRDCSKSGVTAQCGPRSISCVNANDDDDCGAAAHTSFCSEPNVNYFIIVGGAGPVEGMIDLTITEISDTLPSLYYQQPVKDTEGMCSGPFIGCL